MPAAPPLKLAHLLFLLLSLLFLFSSPSIADDLTTTIYSTCSESKYLPNSPYQLNINSLLSSLSAAAGFTLYSKFTTSAAALALPVAGLFQCRGDLSIPDCSSCVRYSTLHLPSLCPSFTGASLQLRGCFLRYGNETFLGQPDTNLRYKTCSTGGNGGGQEFLSAREAAFTSVSAPPITGSSYRAVTAGSVQAQAQCTGDLSLRDCNDCVAAAVSQVEESCGGAATGEAYLGKCYIRYSGSGELPHGSGGGGGGGGEAAGGNNNDNSGKTLAIMIGVIAIIAFIIFCLFYMRRRLKAVGKFWARKDFT